MTCLLVCCQQSALVLDCFKYDLTSALLGFPLVSLSSAAETKDGKPSGPIAQNKAQKAEKEEKKDAKPAAKKGKAADKKDDTAADEPAAASTEAAADKAEPKKGAKGKAAADKKEDKAEEGEPAAKKPRGRPPKTKANKPADEGAEAADKEEPAAKKPRGRPSKAKAEDKAEPAGKGEAAAKKPRGRPPKAKADDKAEEKDAEMQVGLSSLCGLFARFWLSCSSSGCFALYLSSTDIVASAHPLWARDVHCPIAPPFLGPFWVACLLWGGRVAGAHDVKQSWLCSIMLPLYMLHFNQADGGWSLLPAMVLLLLSRSAADAICTAGG